MLTSNRTTRSQLALLLRELGFTPIFHEDFRALLSALSGKPGDLLVDLSMDLSELELERLKAAQPKAIVIGFQHYSESRTNAPLKTNGYTNLIVIPSHAERAKARLKSAFRNSTNESSSTRSWATRAPFSYSRPPSTAKTPRPFATKPKLTRTDIRSRYITAYSAVSKDFVHCLKEECKPGTTLILTGEEGTEHELAAREFNYQFNADSVPLYILPSDTINIKELERLEQKANKAKQPINCYLGRSDDFNQESIQQVELFRQYLDNLRNPHLQLIIAHEHGSECCFHHGVEAPFKQLQSKAKSLTIPPLRARSEDIAPVCHTLLGTLRSAHPFLLVQYISNAAIEHLVEHRSELSYVKLVRLLRNAVALSQRNSLEVEDLKNYGESDMVNQHLLETMADEQFFKEQQSANF
ncbi:hypothetical protein SH580_01805 [Coraliomargarita algicola]|uniref:Sigma-54 factor interaction domain-containing protein n=1 Tax=Coraliomargarita algicola TaxID=3092156 RepID=A0ABZ0RJP4_9BACT|nr:hypothetical protein [Coraliomargarita sp. J2-16]WPJ96435.1 hypothetical protein SH580_01805 [Coraliomargarita sp. J2-16]